MAKKLQFTLDIDTSESEKNLDNLSNQIDDIKDDASKPVDLIIKDAEAAKSISDIRKSLKELKNAMLEAGEGTVEFQRLAAASGNLKDQLDAANDSIKSFSASPVENVVNSFDGLKRSITSLDVEGVKTQFKALSSNMLDLGKSVLGVGKGLNIAQIAARGFGAALAATGIGLIVGVVALLITNFKELAQSGGALGLVLESIGSFVNFVKEGILSLLDAFGLIDKAAMDSAKNQEKYAKDLSDWYDANADAFDEATQKKYKSELDYQNKIKEIRDREDLSIKEKNELILQYQNKRNRELERIEKDASDKRVEDAEKEEAKKQAAIKKAKDDAEAKEKERRVRIFAELEDGYKEQELKLLNSLKNQEISKDEFEERLLDKALYYATQRLNAQKKLGEDTKNVEKEILDLQIKKFDDLEKKSEEATQKKLENDQKEIDAQKELSEEFDRLFQEEVKKQEIAADIAEEKRLERLQKLKEEKEAFIQSFSEIGNAIAGIFANGSPLSNAIGSLFSGIGNSVSGLFSSIEKTKEVLDNVESSAKEKTAAVLSTISEGLNAVNSFVGQIGSILQAQSNERLEQIKSEESAQISSLENQYKTGIITEDQLAKGKEKINEQARKKERQEKKKAFEQNKAIQIIQAIIGTATGIVNAFQLGPIAGAVMAAVIAGIGVAQIAMISSQKFPEEGGGGGGVSTPSVSMGGGASAAVNPVKPPDFGQFTGAVGGAGQIVGEVGGTTQPQGPTQVVVLESDITSIQNQVVVTETRARVG